MEIDFKEINIGCTIKQRVLECKIDIVRICNFLKCSEKEIEEMYKKTTIDAEILLKWSKLLQYDFFRIYSQHIILYAPLGSKNKQIETQLPKFRKNFYTKELIEFILEMLETNKKSKNQIIEEYKIPKTTLYKWISKYQK